MGKTLREISPEKYSSIDHENLVINKFLPVMKQIGFRWLPEEYARRLSEVIADGMSPEEWLRRLYQMHQGKVSNNNDSSQSVGYTLSLSFNDKNIY
jgi:hypothetical protein